MIRQAISCDICGAEKKQTNHWFVVYDQAGELRVSGWNSRNRLRAGSRHLCGQTCLHKLVDEFISRTLAARGPSVPAEVEGHVSRTDASLTSKAAHAAFQSEGFESEGFESDEFESSARLITPSAPIPPQRVSAPVPAALVAMPAAAAVVAMPTRLVADQARPASAQPCIQEAPNYTSRHWRAEAWERERERESRALPTPRRKSS